MRAVGDLLGNNPYLAWIRAWKHCAGPVLNSCCRFAGIETNSQGQRVLCLEVVDPLWRQELEYQRKELAQRFNQSLREFGGGESDLVDDCLLRLQSSVPFKSRLPQKSRNK
jgi:hypothetical protein